MKFIHTADIHLDSPLLGLVAYADAPLQALRTATRDAFSALVDEAVTRVVDFMVIAGDLYDGSWKDYNTGHYFVRQMARLREAGIPVYLLFGNHDAESEMTRRLPLPDNVQVFSSRQASSHRIEPLRVALHGQSFAHAATLDNLALGYPVPVPGWFNIGVLHTALQGNAAHARYAPCSLAELQVRGYDYWALGHVHEHEVLSQSPWVVFPGNLQGRHIGETGPRGAVLVEVDDAGRVSLERLIVDVLRWQRLAVDVAGAADMAAVLVHTGQALADALATQEGAQPLVLRVTLTGRCPAHGQLFGQELALREAVLAQAAALADQRLWIEKLQLQTQPPAEPSAPDDSSTAAERADAVHDLQALLAGVQQDQAFMQSLTEDLQQLAAKAPPELLLAVPELAAVRSGELAGLVQAVVPSLLAQLAAAAPTDSPPR